jgi:fructokinase
MAQPARVVGEALTDVLVGADGRGREVPGGSPANVALGLGRLGHPVRFATRIGPDRLGGLLRERLGGAGVELVPGCVDDGPTSTATATLDARGAATYDFDIAWALSREAVAAIGAGPPAHLHTGSIATALPPGADTVLAAVEAARDAATVSYDPNLRPALLGPPERERARVERLVSASDVVKASDEDLAWLYPGQDPDKVAARWARGGGPALVVLTLGARGARAWWRHGSHEMAPPPVRVVDTVGAGDAFTSGLLSSLLRAGLLGPAADARQALRAATSAKLLPDALTDALALAARAASLTCAREGADPPTLDELAP